jgi:hypothetical protein
MNGDTLMLSQAISYDLLRRCDFWRGGMRQSLPL